MPEDDLERVMADFAGYGSDVLVCTTIIEAGLDMPNVNTLIVDRADMLGLAQLYQLRGRVGRGANRAYAYLMVPRQYRITETAEKRLKTILAAAELGAGFRIAMRGPRNKGRGQHPGRRAERPHPRHWLRPLLAAPVAGSGGAESGTGRRRPSYAPNGC